MARIKSAVTGLMFLEDFDGGFAIVNRLARPKAKFFKASVNVGGFFGSSFAKDQEIISKKEMMDSWRGFGHFHALEVTCSFFFEQKPRQDFNAFLAILSYYILAN
jgi:hypothetical protein